MAPVRFSCRDAVSKFRDFASKSSAMLWDCSAATTLSEKEVASSIRSRVAPVFPAFSAFIKVTVPSPLI